MIKSDNYEIQYLQWDTDYFGIKSARVNLKNAVTPNEQFHIIDQCKEFEFVTISNINNLKENNYWIGRKTNAYLSDVNIQFEKTILNDPITPIEHTNVYNNYPFNEQVLDIAKKVFKYSRFFNDPNLPEEKAKNIYQQWILNAFCKADKYFAVSEMVGDVAGYLLFSINEDVCTIELIAVNSEYQGMGIGKSLVSSMEKFLNNIDINSVKVGTQINNISAFSFYSSLGFRYMSCNTIYHLFSRSEY